LLSAVRTFVRIASMLLYDIHAMDKSRGFMP
jgi:hypothetical protein